MSMGQQFEDMLKEFVEEAVGEVDIDDKVSDAVKEELSDMDDKIKDEVSEQLPDVVKDEVADQLKDAVRDEVSDQIGNLDDQILDQVNTVLDSPEFEAKLEKKLRKMLGRLAVELFTGVKLEVEPAKVPDPVMANLGVDNAM